MPRKAEITTNVNLRGLSSYTSEPLVQEHFKQLGYLVKQVIKLRVHGYHLDMHGQPLAPYARATLRSKKKVHIPDEPPWSESQDVLDKLEQRAAELEAEHAPEDELQALYRSIGHFRQLVQMEKQAFYAQPAMKRALEDVDLYRTGKMLDRIRFQASDSSVTVKPGARYAGYHQTGITARKKEDGQSTGRLPSRPFFGLTDAEQKWLMEYLESALGEFCESSLLAWLTKEPVRLKRDAARKIKLKFSTRLPTKEEERRG